MTMMMTMMEQIKRMEMIDCNTVTSPFYPYIFRYSLVHCAIAMFDDKCGCLRWLRCGPGHTSSFIFLFVSFICLSVHIHPK